MGVWLQEIDQSYGKENGRVMTHNHGAEKITEIVITEGDSIYAGLPQAIKTIGKYKIHLVPAGTIHGSDT